MGNKLTVQRLDGTPYEIGRVHGKAWASVIAEISARNLKSVIDLAKANGGPAISASLIRGQLESYSPLLERHLPDLYEETRGIADGAGMDYLDILALNGFLDLFDLTFPHIADKILGSGGCTAFAASGINSQWAYMGQNYDVRNLFEPGVMLMDLRPKNGPRALVLTLAGMVGCTGINEAGVTVVINNLTPRDSRPGILHQHMVRHILAQERIGDAVNAVTGLPRASGFSYLIGDRSGEFIGLETSAADYDVYLVNEAGFTCHCNHYVIPAMRHHEGTPATNGDSIARFGRARHRLMHLEEAGPLEDLKSMCQDHTNHPYSICRHTATHVPPPFGTGKTVFSVIYDPVGSTVHACKGNPCESAYEMFQF